MNDAWLWGWWLRAMPGQDRLVLLAATTLRLAGLAMVAGALTVVWPELPHPGGALLLAVGAGVETVAVLAWWLHRQALDLRALLVDVPAGVAVLVLGAALARHHGVVGWTWFGYPYTVLASVTLGLVCRPLPVVLGCGATWAAGYVVASATFDPAAVPAALGACPAYLIMCLVGWLCARLLRRTTDELEQAQAVALREAGALAMARERRRNASALHDRILQTLEALARGEAVGEPALRATVAERAEWLRSYVETGRAEQDDLAAALAAVARVAARDGVAVQLNDARLRGLDRPARLSTDRRDVLVDATHQVVLALGRAGAEVVVRAAPEDGGMLVTILGVHGAGLPPEAARQLADTEEHVRRAGGRATIEPLPYVELWLPTGDAVSG